MRYTYENTAAVGQPKRVFLDGVEIYDVQEADTEESYAIRARRNAEGLLYADEHGGIATERLTGVVVVVPMQGT